MIGIARVVLLAPQANAATKEIHQMILDAIDSQDQIIPIHFEANGGTIDNLRLTPTSENGYSGRISFTAGAGEDIYSDGQYTAADCDARIRIDFDTDNNDFPDTLGMDAEVKGGLNAGGFITIGGAPGEKVDGIYLSITNVSSSESCRGTVTLLLSETVT